MTIGRDTDSPFRTAPDPERADQHRPPVDDKTMRRLRTPFVTRPVPGEPNTPGTASVRIGACGTAGTGADRC